MAVKLPGGLLAGEAALGNSTTLIVLGQTGTIRSLNLFARATWSSSIIDLRDENRLQPPTIFIVSAVGNLLN